MEALQKMADDPLKTCPACEQDSLKKLISAAAFKLKGSGWYETDFKNNGKAKPNDGGNGANGSGGKSNSEKSSDSSPSSKADSKPASGGADKAAS
jgi:putative FmdB family regulatory protein